MRRGGGLPGSGAGGTRTAAAGHVRGREHDAVQQPVLLGLLCGEPAVAVGVLGDLLEGLSGVLGDQLGHPALGVQQLLGLDLDVGGGAAEAGGGLVHQDAGVRQREPLAGGARGQQELTHRGGHAHGDRDDVVLDELHRVVDGHAGGHGAVRADDVEEDVLVRLGGQQEQLRGDLVGDVVVDRLAEEDDSLAEQSVVDLVAEATEGRLAVGGRHRSRHVSTCSLSDGRHAVTGSSSGSGLAVPARRRVAAPLPSYLRTLTRRWGPAVPYAELFAVSAGWGWGGLRRVGGRRAPMDDQPVPGGRPAECPTDTGPNAAGRSGPYRWLVGSAGSGLGGGLVGVGSGVVSGVGVRVGGRGLDRLRGLVLVVVLEVHRLTVGVGDLGGLHDHGQRLAAGDLADQDRHLAALADGLRELVRGHAGGGRAAHEVLGELLLVDRQLLLVDQFVEDELGLDALDRLLLQVGVVFLAGLALALQVGVPVQAHHGELVVLHVVAAGLDLVLEQLLRDGYVDQLDQRVEHPLLGLGGLVVRLHLREPLAAVLAQFLQSVELGGELGEVVVQGGQFALLDVGDGDLDGGLAAGRGAALEVGGEGRVGALLQAGDGLVDAFEELARADGVADAGGDAVLQHLTADAGLQVDHDHVALGGGALDRGGGGEAVAQLLQRLVDVLVRDLDGVHDDLDAGEVRDLDARADVHLGGELQFVAVVELGDVHVGLAENVQLTLVDRIRVELRQRVVDGLFEDRATAEPLVDDARRDLALAEARHRDLLVDLLVRRVEAGLELLEGHLDSESNPGRVQSLDGALHGWVSYWADI